MDNQCKSLTTAVNALSGLLVFARIQSAFLHRGLASLSLGIHWDFSNPLDGEKLRIGLQVFLLENFSLIPHGNKDDLERDQNL